MANMIYNRGHERIAKGDWTSIVLVARLERDSSTYTPDKDDDNPQDMTGFAEITASGYSRQVLASKAANVDDANDQVELDADDLSFGSIAAGQTVESLVITERVGGADDDVNDWLIARIDTDSGALLPKATSGGAFVFKLDAEGLFKMLQGT